MSNTLGLSDAAAAQTVQRWRGWAERYDALADAYRSHRQPAHATLARSVAAEWRQDADDLARQLQGPNAEPLRGMELLEHLDHNVDDLREDAPEGEDER